MNEIVPLYLPPTLQKRFLQSLGLICICLGGIFLWSGDSLNVHYSALTNNKPVGLRIFAPSIVQKNRSFEITVEAWDYCERLVCGYDRQMSFFSTDSFAILPEKYTFQSSGINQGLIEAQDLWIGDGGLQTFTCTFNTTGLQYVFCNDSAGLAGMSNAIMVFENIPDQYLYWGDIHGHTSRCDGSGSLAEVFAYARDVARCDFAAVSNHDHFVEPIISGALQTAWWNNQKWYVNQWNQPNRFVTLQAYEYRGELMQKNSVGDMVVYSRGDDIPFYGGEWADYSTPDLWFAALKKWSAESNTPLQAIPHHPPHKLSGLTYDWSYLDPDVVRLVEMYSVHGSSEMMEAQGNPYPLRGGGYNISVEINQTGYYVQDALSMGIKVGFMGSGDSHDGHIGHSISHTDANHLLQEPLSWGALPHLFRTQQHYSNGMTAVFASNLTRESIYDAMWNRNCYSVKGVSRPYIDFRINDQRIGMNNSTVVVPISSSVRNVSVLIGVGGGSLANSIVQIDIFKNNELWQSVKPLSRTYQNSWQDSTPITGMSYNLSAGETRADGKYYINSQADISSDPSTLNTSGQEVYYLRMLETEG